MNPSHTAPNPKLTRRDSARDTSAREAIPENMPEGAETRKPQNGVKVLPRVGTRDGADRQAGVLGGQMPRGRPQPQRQVCLLGRDHPWVTGLPKPPIQTVNPPKGVKYHNPRQVDKPPQKCETTKRVWRVGETDDQKTIGLHQKVFPLKVGGQWAPQGPIQYINIYNISE